MTEKQPQKWTIIEILNWTKKFFEKYDIINPQLNAEILLAHLLKMKRLDLYLNYDQPLNKSEKERFKLMIKERITHKPLQYILGETNFYGFNFFVNPNTLIPRPETELLVEEAINSIKKYNFSKIIDIGTGSGNIAITIAKYFPTLTITATDISMKALLLAKQNAIANKINNIKFIRSDIWEKLNNKKFDLILSNPPYITHNEMQKLPNEVKNYEPTIALNGGKDGLDIYRKIFTDLKNHICKNAMVILEMGYQQKHSLTKLVQQMFLVDQIKVKKDYNGLDRIFIFTIGEF